MTTLTSEDIGHLIVNGANLIDGIDKSDLAKNGTVSQMVDVLDPLLKSVAPGAAVLTPIVKSILLPLAESALSEKEYTDVMEAVYRVEKGLLAATSQASAAKHRVAGMSDNEVNEFLDQHDMFRD